MRNSALVNSDEERILSGLGSSLDAPPATVTHAPVLEKLDVLPLDLMSWEDFEKLLWRMLCDVEGLRHATLYGDRGQAQKGLDVVAIDPGGSGVALQSKHYEKFYPSDLVAAIDKFRTTQRPFALSRFIVAMSCEARSTQLVEDIATAKRDLAPLEFEAWDKLSISQALRAHPQIVIEFFGEPTAERFCYRFARPIQIPNRDAIAVSQALSRTPEVQTGASSLLEDAIGASASDPAHAVELVERAQALLREAGFLGHAAAYEERRTTLLANLGRSAEAAHSLLEEMWVSLEDGSITAAQELAGRLRRLSDMGGHDVEDRARIAEAVRVANAAINLHQEPLGARTVTDAMDSGSATDRARLLVLAGETALADDDSSRLEELLPGLEEAIRSVPHNEELRAVRLRLLVAEVTGDWTGLLDDARRRRLEYRTSALVIARHARYLAIRQEFADADQEFDEAADRACLAERWQDAARWVLSRRWLRTRWSPFALNELLPVQTALARMGQATYIVPCDEDALDSAREALMDGRLRPAAICARRALRDAVASADWAGEARARRLLGQIFADSDEAQLAAHHYSRAGHTKAAAELVQAHSNRYIDVLADLDAPNYWTVAFAYNLNAEQADLVPDGHVDQIVQHALDDLDRASQGTLVDLYGFASSRFASSIKVLAALSDRLTPVHAGRALTYFEQQPPVDTNHYRFHDDDEARAVARIGAANGELRVRALKHLIQLLARSDSARRTSAYELIENHIDLAEPMLAELAGAENRWAVEVLAAHDRIDVAPTAVDAALDRLTTPLRHVPGVFTVGTGAVADSLLLRGQPPAVLARVVGQLLERVRDSHVGSSDRADYLLAASNLVDDLPPAQRELFFPAALRCALAEAHSMQDEYDANLASPLGFVRITAEHDSRQHATFLAARLANTREQRAQAKSAAYALLGAGLRSEYWVARAFQSLGDDLRSDVGFLLGQGWACRSLAALVWAEHGEPVHLGMILARDPDVRVRRALAGAATSDHPAGEVQDVRRVLAVDPCYSVRAALQ